MSTVAALDYTQLSTWKHVDPSTACLRIGAGNAGGISVCTKIYVGLKEHQELLANFFLQCEVLDLKGWKVWTAYDDYSGRSLEKLVVSVLKADEVMLKTITEREKKMKS